MRASLVQIGNSRGIRIPKPLLEQTGLRDEVEIEVRGEQLVIRSANPPRAGWVEAFARMAERGDESEWKW
jgi:antitoxin MazE